MESWEILEALRKCGRHGKLAEYLGVNRMYISVWNKPGTEVPMRFRPQVAALAVAWDIISMDRAIEWLGLGPADLDRLRRLRQKPDRTRPSLASKLAALARPDMTASELAEAANRAGLPNSMSSIYKATKAHGIQLRKVQGNRTKGATRLGGKQKEGKYHV